MDITFFFPQDLSSLADRFEYELSLSNGSPLIKQAYSTVGLQWVSELQESLYPDKLFIFFF